MHHLSSLIVLLQKSWKAEITEGMKQSHLVAHLQKNAQAACRTCKIKELLTKDVKTYWLTYLWLLGQRPHGINNHVWCGQETTRLQGSANQKAAKRASVQFVGNIFMHSLTNNHQTNKYSSYKHVQSIILYYKPRKSTTVAPLSACFECFPLLFLVNATTMHGISSPERLADQNSYCKHHQEVKHHQTWAVNHIIKSSNWQNWYTCFILFHFWKNDELKIWVHFFSNMSTFDLLTQQKISCRGSSAAVGPLSASAPPFWDLWDGPCESRTPRWAGRKRWQPKVARETEEGNTSDSVLTSILGKTLRVELTILDLLKLWRCSIC